MLEISKNFQGHNFSPNSWGGTFSKATFIHLPTVKISPKSDKNPASDMDLKFAKFQKIFRAVILVQIRGEAHFPRQLSASYLVSKFRPNRSNGLRATSIWSFQDLALHLCAVCCDAMSGDYRSLVLYHRAAEERRSALQRWCAALTHKCKARSWKLRIDVARRPFDRFWRNFDTR